MTCTYYGASTAKFTNDIAKLGVVRDEKYPELFRIPGTRGLTFAANGADVAYVEHGVLDRKVKALPKVLIRNLEEPVMVEGWYGGSRRAVNIDFLISCKMLDVQAYTEALQCNPSPVALSIACNRARATLKPDFPRTRKGGVNLLDFIEELVYFDLKFIQSAPPDVSFTTPSYMVVELGRDGSKYLYVQLGREFGLRFSRDAYLGNSDAVLDVNYFEKMGLLKVSSFNIFAEFMSWPEAFQRSVRETLGYHVVDTSTTELPSGLLDD